MTELSVLLPTLNEADNLRRLLPGLKGVLARLKVSYEVLVVDGGSTDKTADVARAEGARVVRQTLPGFGGAVRDGLREAKGEYILALDADGSHPPETVERLWARREGRDLVIASRFAPGGSASLSLGRSFLSRLLNLVTRWWLGFPAFDASSGFRLYRAGAVKGLSLSATDFSIQQEILAHVLKGGGKVEEIPFHYDFRGAGRSKARVMPLALSYLRMLFELKILLEGPAGLLAPAALLAVGLATGLWGLGWGLPGPGRLRAFPERLKPTPAVAQKFADGWARLYEDIRRSHQELQSEEPVTYVKGLDVIEPGWDFPPDKLANSYRSLLLQAVNPDEKKSFIILSQMRPWKLEFKPLYVQYGGAFIYPLGAFIKLSSWLGAAALVPDMRHYLQHPEDMGRLYLLGRLFVLFFQLGSLLLLYDMGKRLSGWRTGLCAALLFALCPTVVINSHILKPHPYAAFWALASVRWLLLAAETGSACSYALCGLASGLAAGANFSLAPFLGLPVLAWLSRRTRGEAAPGEWKRVLGGLVSGPALCLALNPYLLFARGDFAWELGVYAPPRLRLTMEGLTAMASAAASGMGPLCAGLSLAACAAALFRGKERRLLAVVVWGVFLVLWTRFWPFANDPGVLRLYYPLVALACLLGADLLLSGPWPRTIKALVVAALLIDGGLRAGVCLANLGRDSGPASTRERAADWIERNIPDKASIGLIRYPEPAHTPPFRYDRYRLVVFDKPEALPAKKLPDFVVVDAPGRALLDDWVKKNYDEAAVFSPASAGWARAADESSFVNGEMFVFRRKP